MQTTGKKNPPVTSRRTKDNISINPINLTQHHAEVGQRIQKRNW
jgi:hypothetical protein